MLPAGNPQEDLAVNPFPIMRGIFIIIQIAGNIIADFGYGACFQRERFKFEPEWQKRGSRTSVAKTPSSF